MTPKQLGDEPAYPADPATQRHGGLTKREAFAEADKKAWLDAAEAYDLNQGDSPLAAATESIAAYRQSIESPLRERIERLEKLLVEGCSLSLYSVSVSEDDAWRSGVRAALAEKEGKPI